MTHIRVILPAHSTRACNMTMLKPYESAELKLSLSYAEMEASSMRTSFEINLFSNATLQKVIEAEQEGVDAIVISLMGEIATTAMLEAVSIPVVSLPKIAFFTAVSLAYRFSIVSTTPQIESVQVPLITKYGLNNYFASYRTVDFPPEYDYTAPENVEALAQTCLTAIEEDGAGAIVFGSGRIVGIKEKIKLFLEEKGYQIPLIEGLPLGIRYAKLLADLDLTQSSRDFPNPSNEAKERLAHISALYSKL